MRLSPNERELAYKKMVIKQVTAELVPWVKNEDTDYKHREEVLKVLHCLTKAKSPKNNVVCDYFETDDGKSVINFITQNKVLVDFGGRYVATNISLWYYIVREITTQLNEKVAHRWTGNRTFQDKKPILEIRQWAYLGGVDWKSLKNAQKDASERNAMPQGYAQIIAKVRELCKEI